MKRLTLIQINHLTARADVLFDNMARKEKGKLGPRPAIISYTDEQKLELIRTKKATLKPTASGHTDIRDAFEFPATAAMKRMRQLREAWDKKAATIDDKYKARKQTFVDAAILGDSTDALEALRDLETEVSKAA